ncbi:universal stress protein [Candidatus Nitrospira salsa]
MNILLAVDDSTHSQNTIQFLRQVHFPLRSTLRILMVVEPLPSSSKARGKHDDPASLAHDRERKKAWDLVNRMAEACWKPNLRIIPLVDTGIPGATILDAIEKHDIDLTVLGTYGRTVCQRFLLGSVSEWVLTEAPSSVLIVRGESETQRISRASGMKILVGMDGSDDAKAAVNIFRQLKFPPSSKIIVCSTVNEQPTLDTHLTAHTKKPDNDAVKPLASTVQRTPIHRAEKMLGVYVDLLEKMDLHVQKKLAYGHPAEQLLILAERKKCDVIVLGSRGTTGLRKFFLGSVSNRVACHATCSVLVVRKPSTPKRSQRRES